MKRITAVALTGCLLAGCDFELPSQRRAKEEALRQEAVRQEKKETEREQTQSACAALEQFVAFKLKMFESSREGLDKKLEELKVDRQKLSTRLDELSEKSMADKSGTRESALFTVLKDPEINALAFKYIGNDFVAVRSEFAEKVRRALKLEQQKKTALDRNRAEYDKAVEERRNKARQNQQESAAAADTLKHEISETDQRLQKLRRRVFSINKQERERVEREIRLTEVHLANLRSQYSAFRVAGERAVQSRDADYEFDSARTQAIRERREADAEVLLRTKDDMTAFQLAEAYEMLTVRKLDGILYEKLLATRAQKELLAEQVIFLSNVTNGIDRLDIAGLQQIRQEVEYELARKPGEERKSGNGRNK
jgi:hypothetical protein